MMEIPMDCKPCPQGGYCPGQQACECHSDTLRAEVERLRGELEEAKEQREYWENAAKEMRGYKEAAAAHAAELRAALEDAVGDIDETIHFYRPEGWSSEDLSASKALLPVLKATLASTPAQSLADIKARALREAADEIAVELVHWTDDGYGLAARSEREIMIHHLRSKAERLEKDATDENQN